jgi:hypothetical protein
MKRRQASFNILISVFLVLGEMLSHGQEAPTHVRKENRDEIALLEELKGYIRVDNPSNEPRMLEVIRELTEIASTNVVNFFLGNISWTRFAARRVVSPTTLNPDTYFPAQPMYDALLKVKEVPLRKCIDVLMESQKNIMLECFIAQIHGGDAFLREVETIIEESPDPRRRQAIKERLEKNAILRLPDSKSSAVNETAEKHDNLGADGRERPTAKIGQPRPDTPKDESPHQQQRDGAGLP